jgi:hypothetical protein
MQPTHNTTTTSTTSTTGASAGGELGSKVKYANTTLFLPLSTDFRFDWTDRGAFQAVHGMGEQLRGNILDAADAATGDRTADSGHLGTTGVSIGAKNAALERKGEVETQEGMSRMGTGPGSTL